tara:strand:- start:815 stop:1090 length:276 start_codon:yes stop_codon:yes gene_type:complete
LLVYTNYNAKENAMKLSAKAAPAILDHMTINIIESIYLDNPKFNGINEDVFYSIYPFSIQSGETHLGAFRTYDEAKKTLDIVIESHKLLAA